MTTHWACNQSDCHNVSLVFGASLKDPLMNGDHCLMRYTHERCDGTLRLVEPEAVALAVASLAAWGRSAGYRDTDDEPTLKEHRFDIPIPETGRTR